MDIGLSFMTFPITTADELLFLLCSFIMFKIPLYGLLIDISPFIF